MAINPGKVSGRRELRFQTIYDVQSDAEALAERETIALGNWSLGQILRHLAYAVEGSVQGFKFRFTWIEIQYVRLFMKRNLLTRGIRPNYGNSRRWESVMPGPTTTSEGLAAFREAIARYRSDSRRHPHPVIGPMTLDEWEMFHCRHSELHLSFVVPITLKS